MSNSKLSEQGQIGSMYCRTLLLQRKPKLGCIAARGLDRVFQSSEYWGKHKRIMVIRAFN